MTATVLPAEAIEPLSPNYVAPFVTLLSHESCPDNGALYEVAAGYIARQRFERSAGFQYDVNNLSAESVAKDWEKVNDFDAGTTYPKSNQEFLNHIMKNLKSQVKEEPAQPSTGLQAESIFNMMSTFL